MQLRGASGGASIESVGMWNEPNLVLSRAKANSFLAVTNDSSVRVDPGKLTPVTSSGDAVPKAFVNTATRYGKLYAAGYHGLVDAGKEDLILSTFGELTSGYAKFYASTSPRKDRKPITVRPGPWTLAALSAAKTEWNTRSQLTANHGTIPIVKALAVHPYLHKHGPWVKSSRYTFGPAGLNRQSNTTTKGAVQTLREAADLKDVATSTSTMNGSRPPIWATEFGYWTLQGGSIQGSSAHTEEQRWQWMRYTGTGKADEKGALQLLLKDAGARRLNLYGTFELPPKRVGPAPAGPGVLFGDATEDYGIIGSALNPAATPAGEQRFAYGLEQLGRIKGIRPYRKAGNGSATGNSSSSRKVACMIRTFAQNEGVSVPASPYAEAERKC